MQIRPSVSKLIDEALEIYNNSSCEVDNLIDQIEENETVKKAFEAQRKCQQKAIFTTNNLIRGTICQACMNPADYSKNFNQDGESPKLKIIPDAIKKYRENMKSAFECSMSALRDYKKAAKAALQDLLKDEKTCADDLTKISAIFSRKHKDQTCDKDPQFFDQGCLADIENVEEDKRILRGRRVLAESNESSFLEDENGVGVYEEDPEEEKELEALPDDETPPEIIEDDGKQSGDGTPSGSTESSANILGYGLLMILGFMTIL